MGKRLIIKGADFAANGIASEVDITGMFSFENGMAFIGNGTSLESAVFGNCIVDLSDYIGSKVKITMAKYTAASGGQSGYVCYAVASEDHAVWGNAIIIEESSTPGLGSSCMMTIDVTDDTKILLWSYFRAKKQAEYGCPFRAVVLP